MYLGFHLDNHRYNLRRLRLTVPPANRKMTRLLTLAKTMSCHKLIIP